MTADSVAGDRKPWRPLRFPVNLAKRALRSRRLVVLELRNKLLLWPSAVALRRLENREVARLSTALALPEARVAVVVTTYRRPELLLDAVRSALAQSVEDLVVVVVDGHVNGPQVNAQLMSPTSHCAILRASPMLQAPSPFTSQTSG